MIVAGRAGADPGLLRSALAAAALGWHVFPCAPGGKRPALRASWQDLATTLPERIWGWWGRVPYNIGIACGPSRLVVIDLDLARAGTEDEDEPGTLFPLSGADRLARLARRHGERYPAGTYVVDTPSGGCHLYFSARTAGPPAPGPSAPGARRSRKEASPAWPARNSAGVIAPHVDVRAAGGYVVGAGSRIDGRRYAARGPLRPPAPLPPWLARLAAPSPAPAPQPAAETTAPAGGEPRLSAADRVRGRAYAMAALRAETERVAAAQPGTRNDTLNRAAFSLGQLVTAGLLPPVPVITGLISAARKAGLPEEEASRTVRSGLTGGARKPRAW